VDENLSNHMTIKYSHMLKSSFNQSRKGAWIVLMRELDTTVLDLIFESLKFGNNLTKRYLHTAGFYVTPRSIINYLGWDQVGWSDWVRAYSLITHYPYLEEIEPSPYEIDHVCTMAGVSQDQSRNGELLCIEFTVKKLIKHE